MSLTLRTRGCRLGLCLSLAAVAVIATAQASAAVTPSSAAAAAPRAQAAAPVIDWTDCEYDDQRVFDCATVPVPLDYDDPTGPAISLALIRLPAANPAHRKGSLFINPGGPGGSGVGDVRGNGPNYPAEVRATFDIIGMDPRGIGASTTLRCFTSAEKANEASHLLPFPLTDQEKRDWQKADRLLADSCAANAGPILNHMSTANVARDLDLLRRSVGDEKLNFIGFSYGSYLGTVYANMFPGNVGALVVDGVLDPIAWATGSGTQSRTLPFTTRVRSDAGSERALKEFFTQCDLAGDDCAFAPDSRVRYEALVEQLEITPVELFPGFVLTGRGLLGATNGRLYRPDLWTSFAEFLAEAEALATAPGVQASPALSAPPAFPATAASDPTYQPWEGLLGVACLDTDNPASYAAWNRTANIVASRYPHFGRSWAWDSSACNFWPGKDTDRYTGPWNAKTANPVLVVGNHYDPSTRYEGAVTVSRLLPGARLLTYAGWGHQASITAGNDCIESAITRYLVSNELPDRGTVCQPTGSPFTVAPQDPDTVPLAELLAPTADGWGATGR